jgi:hypothetical protein
MKISPVGRTLNSLGVCVPFIINQTPAAGGDHCHGPRAALSGLWVPSSDCDLKINTTKRLG